MSSKHQQQPLPLTETLRDLALLRASDISLSPLVSPNPPTDGAAPRQSGTLEGTPDANSSVERSYQFVIEARKAIRIHNSEETQAARVDELRAKLEDVTQGLGS
ncbi:hypothetical protein DL96DRAFT_1601838, partial [Flagelloscypha sp. PMI_526]